MTSISSGNLEPMESQEAIDKRRAERRKQAELRLSGVFGKVEMEEAAKVVIRMQGKCSIIDCTTEAERVGFMLLVAHGWLTLIDDSGAGEFRAVDGFWKRTKASQTILEEQT